MNASILINFGRRKQNMQILIS